MKDIDIRIELKNTLLSQFKYDENARVVEELGLCQGAAKIDVAVINGSLLGYEIKSEQDTLLRLPNQMHIYNKVFDYINIVVNEKHYAAIKEVIPEFWGIICVRKIENDFKLEERKPAQKNMGVDAISMLQLLWKEETLLLLEKEGLLKGMKSKPRKDMWEKIANSLPKEKVNEYVRQFIKSRSKWREFDSTTIKLQIRTELDLEKAIFLGSAVQDTERSGYDGLFKLVSDGYVKCDDCGLPKLLGTVCSCRLQKLHRICVEL